MCCSLTSAAGRHHRVGALAHLRTQRGQVVGIHRTQVDTRPGWCVLAPWHMQEKLRGLEAVLTARPVFACRGAFAGVLTGTIHFRGVSRDARRRSSVFFVAVNVRTTPSTVSWTTTSAPGIPREQGPPLVKSSWALTQAAKCL